MPLRPLEQNDYGAGSQLEVAPHLISDRGFLDCENGLLADDGSVYKRGGSTEYAKHPLGVNGKWIWEGVMDPGRRTVMASEAKFGVLGIDAPGGAIISLGGTGFPSLPLSAVFFQHMLFIGGGTIYGGSKKEADYSTGTVTVTLGSAIVKGAGTVWAANVDAGMLFRIAGQRIYVVKEVVSNTELVLAEAFEGATAATLAYTLKRLETASSPYLARKFYAVAGERLVAGENDRFDFSEPNKPHLWKATIYPQETVVENFHTLTGGVRMLGLATIGVDKILVFHTGGITNWSNLARSIVDGNGNSQHRQDVYSRDVVLWGQPGIAGTRSTLIVPAIDNVYLVDGTSAPVPIGDAVLPRYRERLLEGYVPGGAFVARETYFLPIIDTGGIPREVFACRLDKPYQYRNKTLYPWTFLVGDGAKIAYGTVRRPLAGGEKPRILGVTDQSLVAELLSWFEPEEANAVDHTGEVHTFVLVSRDLGVEEAIVRWRKLQLFYQLFPLPESEKEKEESEAPGPEPVEGVEEDQPAHREVPVTREALLSAEVGTGIQEEDVARWDGVSWDEFEWAYSDEGEFDLLEGGAPTNAGLAGIRAQNEWVWMTAVRARYVRYRLVSSEPVAKLVIRGVTMWYAPPGESRHSRVN
jgi:hypothetical protein